MNILNWNIRGMGCAEKRRVLRDIISKEKIDIVGIQETKKGDLKSKMLHRGDFKHHNGVELGPFRG